MEKKNTKVTTKEKVEPKNAVKKVVKKNNEKVVSTNKTIIETTEEVVKEPVTLADMKKLEKPTKEERAKAMEEQARYKRNQMIKNVIFWGLFICLAGIWITDFIATKRSNEPKFCLKKIVHQFEDGTINECKGLGYNVYSYNRTSTNLKTQFSPFFIGYEK